MGSDALPSQASTRTQLRMRLVSGHWVSLCWSCKWLHRSGFRARYASQYYGCLHRSGNTNRAGLAQLANPSYTIERWHTCLVAYLVLIIAALVNIFGRHLLEKMGRIMIIFNLLSFVVVIVVVLAMDDHKQDARFVFEDFQNFTGFPNSYAALLGLLQSAFGMTGCEYLFRCSPKRHRTGF